MIKLEWIAACFFIVVTFFIGMHFGVYQGSWVDYITEYVPKIMKDLLTTLTVGSAIAYIALRINRRTEARELETRRRNALDDLAGIMFGYRELLMNTEYPVSLEDKKRKGVFRHWSEKYEVEIEFVDGEYDDKTKDVLFIHEVRLTKNGKLILRFSFRGEHDLERNSVSIHKGPGELGSARSDWDKAITVLEKVVGGLIIDEGVTGRDMPLSENGRGKIIRGMVSMTSDKDKRLKKAVETLNVKEVQRTIDDVTSIDARDLKGRTFLHCAIRHGSCRVRRVMSPTNYRSLDQTPKDTIDYNDAKSRHKEIIEKIIDAKCDIHAEDNLGVSPIMEAVDARSAMALTVLAEHGACNKMLRNPDGLNCMQLAARKCWAEGLRIIIGHMSDILQCEDYNNLLHLALEKCVEKLSDGQNFASDDQHIETVKMLLEAGADIESKNEDEKTAKEIIAQTGDRTLISVMEEHTK